MEKKDQYHNPEEGQNNPRLEELEEKGAQGLLNAQQQKEYFALVKAQNTASDEVEANPADTVALQNEKAVASDEQSAKADELKAQLEDGVETDAQYLQYAPEEFKALWKKSSPADKEVYKKHVEFTVDGPNIIGESGTKYEIAKDNLTVEDKDLKSGKLDRYEGETYFDRDAQMDYTKKHNISVPTEEMYLDMLKVMPAGDLTKKFGWGIAGRQLFIVLGSKSHNSLLGGKYKSTCGAGGLWSASYDVGGIAIVLIADAVGGALKTYNSSAQFPVRSLRTSK